ncbi:hypothetical protein O6P43_031520 [Quillaja saponaria]|uniref:Uncharacterized protein n=1 Tax=Quillaja saponaria TaxID=32244 RepID=A0AAD7P9I3_QUISA|nr:hypothetical protein O6P43_031520 [Quillaja saponaria]
METLQKVKRCLEELFKLDNLPSNSEDQKPKKLSLVDIFTSNEPATNDHQEKEEKAAFPSSDQPGSSSGSGNEEKTTSRPKETKPDRVPVSGQRQMGYYPPSSDETALEIFMLPPGIAGYSSSGWEGCGGGTLVDSMSLNDIIETFDNLSPSSDDSE